MEYIVSGIVCYAWISTLHWNNNTKNTPNTILYTCDIRAIYNCQNVCDSGKLVIESMSRSPNMSISHLSQETSGNLQPADANSSQALDIDQISRADTPRLASRSTKPRTRSNSRAAPGLRSTSSACYCSAHRQFHANHNRLNFYLAINQHHTYLYKCN